MEYIFNLDKEEFMAIMDKRSAKTINYLFIVG